MNNNQLAEVAKILGVSEDSISAMNDEIKNSMTAVFETVAIRNDEDKKIVFEALDDLWQKGSVYIGLDEVAKSTGILLVTLRSLDYDTQQTIVYEYMMDSSQTERFYDLVNKALAVSELGNVAKLIGVPVRELRPLPRRIQENICGAYTMEYDADSTNTDLIDHIREMIAPRQISLTSAVRIFPLSTTRSLSVSKRIRRRLSLSPSIKVIFLILPDSEIPKWC